MASMSFTQWLRWVFVPRVNALLESGAVLPEHSAVGAQPLANGASARSPWIPLG